VAGDVDQEVGALERLGQLAQAESGSGTTVLVELTRAIEQAEIGHRPVETLPVHAALVGALPPAAVPAPCRLDLLDEEDLVRQRPEAEDVLQPVPRRPGREGR
jgi:hypothetical protein